jgi:hypothetical protein
MAYIYVIKVTAQKVFNGCSNQSTSKASASIFCHSRYPFDDACAAGRETPSFPIGGHIETGSFYGAC